MNATFTISPLHNAEDSLARAADDLIEVETGNTLAWKGVLAWSWHAVDLLAYLQLQPQRRQFDAWMQAYLHQGEPALQVERDARWDDRTHLTLLELLDIFSDAELPILKPEFYQGWQDRATRCQDLRTRAAAIIGGSIDASQREHLLLLLAVYNRMLHMPASISLPEHDIAAAFPALLDLIEKLLPAGQESESLLKLLQQCRRHVRKLM